MIWTRHYRLVLALLTGAAAVWVLRRVGRVEVDGESMVPTLLPGDRLVVVRGLRPRAGDLVTVADPRAPQRVVVKRVAAVAGGSLSTVVVRGDNPAASTDSRTFGPVPARSVRGRVVYRYFPERRRGRPQRERYAAGDVV
jgi:nickel-type superoxide dismutase maturation protease